MRHQPIALRQLQQSIRARICATCPHRTHDTDGQDIRIPRPCEASCPVVHLLPVLETAAEHLDPMVGHRSRIVNDLLDRASAGKGEQAEIVRRHRRVLAETVLEQFHD